MTTALLPCPRCGAPASVYHAFPAWEVSWCIKVEHKHNCHDRGWDGYCYTTEAQAIAGWNRRPIARIEARSGKQGVPANSQGPETARRDAKHAQAIDSTHIRGRR